MLRAGQLQRKAHVSQPDDPREHEADRAAAAVMSGTRPEPATQARSAKPEVQRMPSAPSRM